jgi:hypothetical protein
MAEVDPHNPPSPPAGNIRPATGEGGSRPRPAEPERLRWVRAARRRISRQIAGVTPEQELAFWQGLDATARGTEPPGQ